MRLPTVAVSVLVSALALAGCTDVDAPGGQSADTPSTADSAGPTPALTPERLTAAERAQQLTAIAPEQFDATYRLKSRGPRPDAIARMRVKGEHFRLDIERRRRTAILLYGSNGVVSCQVLDPKKGRRTTTCFRVAGSPKALPDLFDPQLQQLFRSTTRSISDGDRGLSIRRAGTWYAGHGLGPSECFAVRGKDVKDGLYCYLSVPHPAIGLLAKAVFRSGRLELIDVTKVRRDGLFRPPVRPTPLPSG